MAAGVDRCTALLRIKTIMHVSPKGNDRSMHSVKGCHSALHLQYSSTNELCGLWGNVRDCFCLCCINGQSVCHKWQLIYFSQQIPGNSVIVVLVKPQSVHVSTSWQGNSLQYHSPSEGSEIWFAILLDDMLKDPH